MKLPSVRQVFTEPVAPKNLPDINFAGQINAALAQSAQAAHNVVQSWQQKQEQDKERNAISTATEKTEDARVQSDKLLVQAQQNSKPDGSDYEENAKKLWDDYESQSLQGLTGRAAEIAREKIAPIRGAFRVQALHNAMSIGNKYRIDSIGKSTDTAAVAVESNPDSFLHARQNIVEAITTSGVSPDKAEQLKTATTEKLAEASILGEIRRDPRAILKTMNKRDEQGRTGNIALDYLPLDRQLVLRNQAESAVKQQEAEFRQQQTLNRLELNSKEQNALLSYNLFGTYDNPPSRNEYVSAYGAEEGLKRYDSFAKYQIAATDTLKYNNMSDAEIAADLRTSAPKPEGDVKEASDVYQMKTRRAQNILKMREDDPAQYLVSTNPAVAKAYAGFSTVLSDQNRTPQDVAAATKSYVSAVTSAKDDLKIKNKSVLPAALVDQIVAPTNSTGQNAVQALNSFRERFGSSWGSIAPDVMPKLTDSFKVAMSGMDAVAGARLVELQGTKTDDLRKYVPQGVTNSMVKEQLDKQFRDLTRSYAEMPGGVEAMSMIRDQAERLAISYMASGSSYKDAIERASGEVMTNRYQVRVVDNRTDESFVRVPNVYNRQPVDAALVARGLKTLEGKIDVPRMNETKWMTLADDSGVGLYWMGQPVHGDKGPIRYRWDELVDNAYIAPPKQDENDYRIFLRGVK